MKDDCFLKIWPYVPFILFKNWNNTVLHFKFLKDLGSRKAQGLRG